MADTGGWRVGRGFWKNEAGDTIFTVIVEDHRGASAERIFSHDSTDKAASERLVSDLSQMFEHISGSKPELFMGDE